MERKICFVLKQRVEQKFENLPPGGIVKHVLQKISFEERFKCCLARHNLQINFVLFKNEEKVYFFLLAVLVAV